MTDKSPVEPKTAEPATVINDLAMLVASMNRVMDRLQKVAKDASINITLTDWLLLQALAAEGPQPMSNAAYKIGVSRQRIHQQATPLQAAGLISIAQGDGKSKKLEIAPLGKQLAATLEKEFLKSIVADDGALAAGPVRTAKMSTAKLARTMIANAKAVEQTEE